MIAPADVVVFLIENRAFLSFYIFAVAYAFGLTITFIVGLLLSSFIVNTSDKMSLLMRPLTRIAVFAAGFALLFSGSVGLTGQITIFAFWCLNEYANHSYRNRLQWENIPDEIRNEAKRIVHGKTNEY